jgi:adenylate kinase family enzyme
MKIHIIGASGSGKTTLGQEIVSRLHIPHYDLDKADDIQTAADVIALAEKPAWITEGIYLIWTEPLLYHADCIVLLEISWPVAAWRILRRHILNSLRGQQPYPGINGIKSLIKLLKDTRRYILNLDKVEESSVEALRAYFETHREQAAPPTEEFMEAYFKTYQKFAEPPSEAFVQLYLERYKGKLYIVRNTTDRERLLTLSVQKG